ncbi:MAG: class I SAM-dependent methyltransferase [Planctomycetota bacterium]|jgi:ubiquinone/menaquinone biosynthesis C-methylase UbiE
MTAPARPRTRTRTAEAIRRYWGQRAAESAGAVTATTDDVYLRELEHATVTGMLRSFGLPDGATMLDLGCGDGYTTLHVARQLCRLDVTGIDYAEAMVDLAARRLAAHPELRGRVCFRRGDATALPEAVGDARFDVVMSTRCLINLESPDAQYAAIGDIAALLEPGGRYVAIENFMEGQDAMNTARAAVGLPAIAVRWHNLFFHEDEFRRRAGEHFARITFHDFASAYYYATRVVYSAMCRMRDEEPDYRHEIHRLAPGLPPFGTYSPVRLAVCERGPR